MLDIESALELMKKYGYSSTNAHPYIYQSGDTIGICYTYVDEEYGTLERIKIFDSLEGFEEFLKQVEWLKKNGLNYHVRMCLDNYEAINPKILFLRNEKLMIEGEMDDIENFDQKEELRDQMDLASQILYEAGDLLLIYDEIKKRQMQYLVKIISLKNQLRQMYFDLQKSVDEYNKVKIEREMVKIPEVADNGGIDLSMEIALKDKYNIFIKEVPPVEEVTAFLKEVWELNMRLEKNTRYYDALREETEIRNEMKVVEKKQEYMDKLNENIKPLFGVNLVGKFRKINRTMASTINNVSDSIAQEKMEQVDDKYKYYDKLDLLYVSDYLREAIQNSNYEDLSIKYAKGAPKEMAKRGRTPLNEIASSLLVQYKSYLTLDEQAILVIYNNEKMRQICDAILSVHEFEKYTPKQLIKRISSVKGFSKLKSECYISLRNRIGDPLNKTIKDSLFRNYDFTTFETFISSLTKELAKIKVINNKMKLSGDINMYILVKDPGDIKKKEFILVTNDINTILSKAKEIKGMVGITLLKEKLPVLYSPYYLDLGDIYDKNASPKLEIREMINFELLVDVSDMVINVDKTKVNVINYYSELDVEGNITVAKDIKSSGKTIFVKYAFLPSEAILASQAAEPVNPVNEVPQDQVPVEQTPVEQPVVPEEPVQQQEPVDSGINVQDLNKTVDSVMQQAVQGGSMVAIAAQEASNQFNNLAPVEEPKPEEEPKPDEVSTSIEKPTEEPVPEPIPEPEPEPVPESEKPVVPENEESKEEQPVEETPEEKIEEQQSEPKKEEAQEKEEGTKEDDLDKLLDTLATTMPKDISNDMEDTNKMELFADIAEAQKDKEKKEEKPEEKKAGKTQIVKKIITKPDGTKKVVLVKRYISSGDAKDANIQPGKKIVKKIGQPEQNKKVVEKQKPREEK